jgi:lysozyme
VLPDEERIMQHSERGLALIKEHEGLRLDAYLCPANVWTIGYGSTGPHVRAGMRIDAAEAETLLRADVARFEEGVSRIAGRCTHGQYDALVSFAFNLGLGALMSSTLLKRHKAGDFARAADAFLSWNKVRGSGGKLVVLPGLTKRRAAERQLYLS